jgi:hypothetical protein
MTFISLFFISIKPVGIPYLFIHWPLTRLFTSPHLTFHLLRLFSIFFPGHVVHVSYDHHLLFTRELYNIDPNQSNSSQVSLSRVLGIFRSVSFLDHNFWRTASKEERQNAWCWYGFTCRSLFCWRSHWCWHRDTSPSTTSKSEHACANRDHGSDGLNGNDTTF